MRDLIKSGDSAVEPAKAEAIASPRMAGRRLKASTPGAERDFRSQDAAFINLWTEEEAARMLKVSRKTLQADRASQSPRWPYVKIGRLVRYVGSDLASIVRSGYRAVGDGK